METTESPIFLTLDPRVDPARKNLPVALFETGGIHDSTTLLNMR